MAGWVSMKEVMEDWSVMSRRAYCTLIRLAS